MSEKWTKDAEKYLARNYKRMPTKEISIRLNDFFNMNTTVTDVNSKAWRLGLAETGGYETTPECIYNKAIDCDEIGDKCKTCGWNPEVAEQRRAAN